ncbi:MAG: hypothetical protein JO110_01670 [Acetobacteraceae bacterium]|nr:hypothetical protein [Acetobacteraceae bacterium]
MTSDTAEPDFVADRMTEDGVPAIHIPWADQHCGWHRARIHRYYVHVRPQDATVAAAWIKGYEEHCAAQRARMRPEDAKRPAVWINGFEEYDKTRQGTATRRPPAR